MEGSEWTKKLRYIVYDAEGKDVSNGNYADVKDVVNCIPSLETTVKTVCCLATRLYTYKMLKMLCGNCSTFRIFKGQLRHHFVEIETESGDFFTLEKVPEVYLLQKSPAPRSRFSVPMVREMRNGGRRLPEAEQHLLETVVEDDQPKPGRSVNQIVNWMQRSGLLERQYHLGEDNCQHFAALLWTQLSDKAMPSPGNFGKDFLSLDQMMSKAKCDVVPPSRALSVESVHRAKKESGDDVDAGAKDASQTAFDSFLPHNQFESPPPSPHNILTDQSSDEASTNPAPTASTAPVVSAASTMPTAPTSFSTASTVPSILTSDTPSGDSSTSKPTQKSRTTTRTTKTPFGQTVVHESVSHSVSNVGSSIKAGGSINISAGTSVQIS